MPEPLGGFLPTLQYSVVFSDDARYPASLVPALDVVFSDAESYPAFAPTLQYSVVFSGGVNYPSYFVPALDVAFSDAEVPPAFVPNIGLVVLCGRGSDKSSRAGGFSQSATSADASWRMSSFGQVASVSDYAHKNAAYRQAETVAYQVTRNAAYRQPDTRIDSASSERTFRQADTAITSARRDAVFAQSDALADAALRDVSFAQAASKTDVTNTAREFAQQSSVVGFARRDVEYREPETGVSHARRSVHYTQISSATTYARRNAAFFQHDSNPAHGALLLPFRSALESALRLPFGCPLEGALYVLFRAALEKSLRLPFETQRLTEGGLLLPFESVPDVVQLGLLLPFGAALESALLLTFETQRLTEGGLLLPFESVPDVVQGGLLLPFGAALEFALRLPFETQRVTEGALRLPFESVPDVVQLGLLLPFGAALESALLLTFETQRLTEVAILLPFGSAIVLEGALLLPFYAPVADVVQGALMLPFNDVRPVTVVSQELYALHNGRRVELLDYEVSQGIDSAAWEGRLQLARIEDYGRMRPGDNLILVAQGESYALYVVSRAFSDNGDSGEASFTLRVASPVMRLSEQTITETFAAITALAAVQSILGQAVDWRIVDWNIPAGRIDADAANRLELAQQIAAAAGGALCSKPDGTLMAVYQTGAVAINRLGTGTPVASFDDVQHIFEYSDEPPGDFYDSIVITDEDGRENGVEARYSAELENVSQREATLYIYAYPWREYGQDFGLEHSGHSSIQIIAPPEVEWVQEHEILEFTNGEAAVRFPIYRAFEWDWQHRDLGGIYWQQDSPELKTSGNGFSIASVKYTRRRYKFKIQHGLQQPELTQFLILE
jgi:hypothetical protein